MKYLKVFESYQSDEKIQEICNYFGIKNYTIVDGKVNVDGDVYLYDEQLTKLPLTFGIVTGKFDCGLNRLTSLEGSPSSVMSFSCPQNNLTSLEGCPSEVELDFMCDNNLLTSLKFCPKTVGRDFECHENELTSLEFGPTNVGRDFRCNSNWLTSLKNSPSVKGVFDCSENHLVSLEGIGEVGGEFYCSENKLTNLVGGPKNIKGNYICDNNKITTLVGGPESISGNFYCENNELTSIEGCPDIGDDFDFSNNYVYEFMGIGKIGGSIRCKRNPINNIWSELFYGMEYIELFNYMDPIRPAKKGRAEFMYPNQPIVYLTVLNAFLEQIGERPVATVKGYKCL